MACGTGVEAGGAVVVGFTALAAAGALFCTGAGAGAAEASIVGELFDFVLAGFALEVVAGIGAGLEVVELAAVELAGSTGFAGAGAGAAEALFCDGPGREVGFKEARVLVSLALDSTGFGAGLLMGASAVFVATGTTAGFFSAVVMAPGTLRNFTIMRLASGSSW